MATLMAAGTPVLSAGSNLLLILTEDGTSRALPARKALCATVPNTGRGTDDRRPEPDRAGRRRRPPAPRADVRGRRLAAVPARPGRAGGGRRRRAHRPGRRPGAGDRRERSAGAEPRPRRAAAVGRPLDG